MVSLFILLFILLFCLRTDQHLYPILRLGCCGDWESVFVRG